MTAETLSRLLIENLGNVKLPTPVVDRVIPSHACCYETEIWLDDLFANVRELHRQKCGLDDALPFNASKHAADFEAQVAKLCAEFLERLEVTP